MVNQDKGTGTDPQGTRVTRASKQTGKEQSTPGSESTPPDMEDRFTRLEGMMETMAATVTALANKSKKRKKSKNKQQEEAPPVKKRKKKTQTEKQQVPEAPIIQHQESMAEITHQDTTVVSAGKDVSIPAAAPSVPHAVVTSQPDVPDVNKPDGWVAWLLANGALPPPPQLHNPMQPDTIQTQVRNILENTASHMSKGDGSQLFYQTLATYESALAPGTLNNRRRQATAYITFAVRYHFDYLRPLPINAAMYAQSLANMHKSPASLKNYLSGAKTWISHHIGDPSAFDSPPVQEVIRKLMKDSNHVPVQAEPLFPKEIKIIAEFLDTSDTFPPSVKSCILLTYACMLRSSNVLSPSKFSWGGAHTLASSDVMFNYPFLFICIRSTKTTSSSKPVLLKVCPVPTPVVCPVLAWMYYVRRMSPSPSGPAFMYDKTTPLTVGPVVTAIRSALAAAGYQNVSRFSRHSLTRGAAQLAAGLGAPHSEIMKHGIWRSEAGLRHYVPSSTTVPKVLAQGLAM